ncbi:hypothetical protein H4219_002170 [Mycoemilia scoparia]|uniref:Histone deacetylase 8 n=1 Tax=Mycoemilia scoparia TaxID=417184 RepID=A0A9W8DPF8_9FUNG|nr:hypothetical protein H4219_002170 [Mycoemilia scoparia]
MSSIPRCTLIRSTESIQNTDLLPSNLDRSSVVHALIDVYKVHQSLEIIPPAKIRRAHLLEYHDSGYIDFLLSKDLEKYSKEISVDDDDDNNDNDDNSEYGEDFEDDLQEFGLEFDCPPFLDLNKYIFNVAGGTLAAAEHLNRDKTDVAIHWEGGRHHAGRDQASGFCYVNDVVLGILHLQRKFSTVLYIDLDLHHGDGTGSINEDGKGKGKNFNLNIPLKAGLTDAAFTRIFERIMAKVFNFFSPQAVVVQCGCDGLSGDPNKIWNLTSEGYIQAINSIVQTKLPLLLVGGGGYSTPDVARCWIKITSAITQPTTKLENDIPPHEYFDLYKPSFELDIAPSVTPDENTDKYIDEMLLLVDDRYPDDEKECRSNQESKSA